MIGTTSIAITFFQCATTDDTYAYLCSGITDDLITQMTRLGTLAVVARDDVLPFRGRNVGVRDLGEALVADYVLTGTVSQNDGGVRVYARLVEVQSDTALWEGQYNRSKDEIIDVLNEILHGTARALKVTSEEAGAVRMATTKDPRAYDHYLRGRHLFSHRGRSNVEAALEELRKAIDADDSFAAGHLALAEAAIEMFTFYDDDDLWLERAMQLSGRALELDAGLSEARFLQGVVHYHRNQLSEAKTVMQSVVATSPGSYQAHRWLGIVSDLTGQYDEALTYYETAARLKPYSVEPWLFMNMTHRRKGDMDAAMVSARRFLEVGIRKLEINPDDEVTLSRFAAIYTLLGEGDKARDALERILKWHPDDGTVLYNCACTYALLGNNEQALLCLRMALEHGYRNVREWVKTDPDFSEIRETDAFKQLLVKFDTPR